MGWVGWKKSPQKITKQPVVEVEMVVEISSWFNAGFYKFYASSQVGFGISEASTVPGFDDGAGGWC